jgi:ferritin-like metal-binding protein YciE
MEIDLENLTKEDFVEMARYVHSMEKTLERAKAEMLTLVTQRNNLQSKVNQLNSQLFTPVTNVTQKAKLTDDLDLVNPEQYREKKQF